MARPAAELAATEDASPEQLALAERIHRWRRTRGWTQAELAARAGFARSTLSKIENGILCPTFEILVKLARGFDVDVAALISAEAEAPLSGRLVIDRGGDGPMAEDSNNRIRPLAGQLKGKRFESFEVEFTCHDLAAFGDWNRHDTEDMLYVLSGRLAFHSEGYETFILEPGQSIQFDGRMAHACLSAGEETCRCLYVCAR